MNSCERVDSLLSAYLESETSPAESRFIDGHLTVCARCREQVDGTAALLERLSRLPGARVSDDFTERVLAEVKGLPAAGLEEPVVPIPSGHTVRWAVPLAAAAALAVALIGFSQLRAPVPRTGFAGAEKTVAAPAPRTATGAATQPVDFGSTPPVASLPDLYPDLDAKTEGPGEPLGMAGDSYALEDWVLREPPGGGDAVLTRVGSDPTAKVVVTF
jgi:anti-sigma factor RsiW